MPPSWAGSVGTRGGQCALCLRLQGGCSVRVWRLTSWGRGPRSGGAMAVGVCGGCLMSTTVSYTPKIDVIWEDTTMNRIAVALAALILSLPTIAVAAPV